MDRHQQAGAAGAVIEHVIGSQDGAVLGCHVRERRRDLGTALEPAAVREKLREHPIDPCRDGCRIVGVEVGYAATHFGAGVGVEVVEPVRPDPSQYRQREEWTAGFDQPKPVGVRSGNRGSWAPDRGHRSPPSVP
ncbi:MAG: hypothetical protein ACYDH6_13920 [Acidimicrobiales bacterium]